jgi:hypothetical protein
VFIDEHLDGCKDLEEVIIIRLKLASPFSAYKVWSANNNEYVARRAFCNVEGCVSRNSSRAWWLRNSSCGTVGEGPRLHRVH